MTIVWTRLAIADVQAITRFIAQNKGVGPPNFILTSSSPLLYTLFGGARVLASSARVQRGPSEAARCASTGDHQAPSSPWIQTSAQGSGRGCP